MTYNPSDHPRNPKGTPQGGQFTNKAGVGVDDDLTETIVFHPHPKTAKTKQGARLANQYWSDWLTGATLSDDEKNHIVNALVYHETVRDHIILTTILQADPHEQLATATADGKKERLDNLYAQAQREVPDIKRIKLTLNHLDELEHSFADNSLPVNAYVAMESARAYLTYWASPLLEDKKHRNQQALAHVEKVTELAEEWRVEATYTELARLTQDGIDKGYIPAWVREQEDIDY